MVGLCQISYRSVYQFKHRCEGCIMELISSIFSILQTIGAIALGLFSIGFIIGFHELGHFLFCKLFRVATPTFSIGFGPKIFSKKIGATEFVLSAIPLGGFVEIAGAAEMGQGEQKMAHSTDKYSFAKKPYYQKLCIMLGGIAFNFAFAYMAFIFLCMIGIPKTPIMHTSNGSTKIERIEPGSPADAINLQQGDIVVTIDNVNVENNTLKLVETIQSIPNKRVNIGIMRDKQPITYRALIASKEINGQTVGSLGIECAIKETTSLSIGESFSQGIAITNYWIKRTVMLFVFIFQRGDVKNLGGPLAVIGMTMQGASAGLKILLLLMAIISINLAILNLIPLPILDGGQILFYTIEAIIGRPLPLKVREYIHIGSWIFILALTVILSVRDVGRMAIPAIEKAKELFGILPK